MSEMHKAEALLGRCQKFIQQIAGVDWIAYEGKDHGERTDAQHRKLLDDLLAYDYQSERDEVAFVHMIRGSTACTCGALSSCYNAKSSSAQVGTLDELLDYIEAHPHMVINRLGRAGTNPAPMH